MSYEPIWDGRSGYGGKGRHRFRNFVLILLALAAVCFAALEVYIGLNSRDILLTNPEPSAMVIFGCKVESWGPSVLLQDRLDTALDYLEDHPDMKIVVTGGKGDDEHMSEAQCMYNYLTEHGVDGENILMEDRSRNTWQNVNFCKPLMESNGMDCMADCRPILVSSGFHLGRIKMLWERVNPEGWTPSTLAAPVSHIPSAVKMFFREPLALVKSFLIDR